MKKLTLQIKRNFLDEILSGEKKEEYREIRPKNGKKYLEFFTNDEGEEDFKVREYTHIQFFNGYKTNRPEVLIEIKKSELLIITDEEGNDIIYEENGEEYIMAQMVYTLGKIIERKNI